MDEDSLKIMTEVAKTATKTTIKEISGFLSSLIGKPAEEFGLLCQDSVRQWRFYNQVEVLQKAKQKLEQRGINPQSVSLKSLAPLLEYCSYEDNQNLKEKWASLLANLADNNKASKIHSNYVEILNQISSTEANILDVLYTNYNQTSLAERETLSFDSLKICTFFKISQDEFNIILDNLIRLNLLQPPASHRGMMVGKYPVVIRTHDTFQLTYLGITFIEACK